MNFEEKKETVKKEVGLNSAMTMSQARADWPVKLYLRKGAREPFKDVLITSSNAEA